MISNAFSIARIVIPRIVIPRIVIALVVIPLFVQPNRVAMGEKTTIALSSQDENRHVVVVVGASGTDEYRESFDQWAKRWEAAAIQADADYTRIGGVKPASLNDRDRVKKTLDQMRQSNVGELWLVLIGHGTFDGETAKFNLVGPDITASELNEWLDQAAETIVAINCASASGPFIHKLAGSNRVVVTSTNSGYEFNFSRFGDFLSAAISGEGIDLDKDRQTSLLEAFIVASAKTLEFYETESRLATEHALIEDNGDRKGTPGEWFRGIRAARAAKDGAATDGLRANQLFLVYLDDGLKLSAETREQRDRLEQQLEELRRQKTDLSEAQYWTRVEPILIQLAELYRDATNTEPDSDAESERPDLKKPAGEKDGKASPVSRLGG